MVSVKTALKEIGKVVLIPRVLIRPFPDQPRKFFDQQKLKELAISIKAVGQIVPVFVKDIEDDGSCEYELVDGQRRWHATGMAGVEDIKAIVVNPKDKDEQFLISVVSNFGKEDHTPIDIAKAIQRFRDRGMSVVQISEIFAKSGVWIYQHLKILKLDLEVQKMMAPEIPENERLLFSTALTLSDLPLDMQKDVAKVILKKGLKTNQARNLIRCRAEKAGVTVGDPNRTPRSDYRNFLSFIKRLARELEMLTNMQQGFFNKMFEFRQDDDRLKIIEKLDEGIQSLQILLAATKKAQKKT
jgi:ParB family transcriptional regulator, chromosome partitioning protein